MYNHLSFCYTVRYDKTTMYQHKPDNQNETQTLWLADISSMTCRNISNGLILQFIKNNKSLDVEIKELPISLQKKVSKNPENLTHLQNLIDEGKIFFLRSYQKK